MLLPAVLLRRGVYTTSSMSPRPWFIFPFHQFCNTDHLAYISDKITMWILPHEWRDTVWTQGWILLACLIGTEVLSMVTPARFLQVWPLSRLTKMDHAAHLGGYLAGAGCGYNLIQKKRAERQQRARDSRWLNTLTRWRWLFKHLYYLLSVFLLGSLALHLRVP